MGSFPIEDHRLQASIRIISRPKPQIVQGIGTFDQRFGDQAALPVVSNSVRIPFYGNSAQNDDFLAFPAEVSHAALAACIILIILTLIGIFMLLGVCLVHRRKQKSQREEEIRQLRNFPAPYVVRVRESPDNKNDLWAYSYAPPIESGSTTSESSIGINYLVNNYRNGHGLTPRPKSEPWRQIAPKEMDTTQSITTLGSGGKLSRAESSHL